MTTTSKSTSAGPNAKAIADHARSTADKVVAGAKRATAANIDSYEKSVQSLVDFEHKLADGFDVEPISSITNAYADLTREIGTAQASAARTLLRV
jgi:hypothetical protein